MAQRRTQPSTCPQLISSHLDSVPQGDDLPCNGTYHPPPCLWDGLSTTDTPNSSTIFTLAASSDLYTSGGRTKSWTRRSCTWLVSPVFTRSLSKSKPHGLAMSSECQTVDYPRSYCIHGELSQGKCKVGCRRNISRTASSVPQRPERQSQHLGVACPGLGDSQRVLLHWRKDAQQKLRESKLHAMDKQPSPPLQHPPRCVSEVGVPFWREQSHQPPLDIHSQIFHLTLKLRSSLTLTNKQHKSKWCINWPHFFKLKVEILLLCGIKPELKIDLFKSHT